MEERASRVEGNREVEEDNKQEEENGGSGIREEIYSEFGGAKSRRREMVFYHESLVGLVQLGEVELRNVRLPLLTFFVCCLRL